VGRWGEYLTISHAVAACWRERAALPARVIYDGPTPVRILVPLSGEDAGRVEGWITRPAATEGRVRIAERRLIIPRDLYEALRPRIGRWEVRRLHTMVVVRASRHGLPAQDMGPSGFAILDPCLWGVEGEFPAVVLRGRRQLNPRLVVRVRREQQMLLFEIPPNPERLLEVVRREVRKVALSHADREELEQELWARAWERAQERDDVVLWARGAAIDAVRRRTGLLASRGREAEDLDGLDEQSRARLEASRPWPSPTLVELRDLLGRELLPVERRFVALLASGYTPEEAAGAVGVRDGDALLARVRAIVARALDEAGQPPLRPSERWARGQGKFPALPAAE
jgi:hypothetical protein